MDAVRAAAPHVMTAERAPAFSVDVDDAGAGRARLVASGELDVASVPVLREALERHRATRGELVVDLSDVTFIDSAGLRLLIQAHRDAARGGWSFALGRELPPQVVHLLELTALRGYFRLH